MALDRKCVSLWLESWQRGSSRCCLSVAAGTARCPARFLLKERMNCRLASGGGCNAVVPQIQAARGWADAETWKGTWRSQPPVSPCPVPSCATVKGRRVLGNCPLSSAEECTCPVLEVTLFWELERSDLLRCLSTSTAMARSTDICVSELGRTAGQDHGVGRLGFRRGRSSCSQMAPSCCVLTWHLGSVRLRRLFLHL